jgi:hypothetical protein
VRYNNYQLLQEMPKGQKEAKDEAFLVNWSTIEIEKNLALLIAVLRL